ncbi:MAG: hypothetical protein ACJA2S_002146 [Cyclobacteriaceae bacterium]|jgi:hypothetical protein
MNKASLKIVGIGAGFLVLFLATNQFVESYQKGETKWYSLVMMSGMSLLLYYTLFNVKLKPPTKKK